MDPFRVLFIGDVVGQPGKYVLSRVLKELREDLRPDLVVANGENLAGGKGVTPNLAAKCFGFGVDVLTTGNHVWKNREVFRIVDTEPRLLRPLNFPPGAPGRGFGLYGPADRPVAVINLIGRINLLHVDCPFRAMDELLASPALRDVRLRIVDFHAETTSEKVAMGWHLDGRVTALLGTHTHVPTADEAVLPGGTAYITDVGMTGPHDSVLGVEKRRIVEHFITQMPVQFAIAEGDLRLNAVVVEADPATGRALSIRRLSRKVEGYAPGNDQGT